MLFSAIKNYIKKRLLGYKYNSATYEAYLVKRGVRIGQYLKIFSPQTTTIDITRPYLLEIGSNVRITANVTILTHDYSYSVLRVKYHDLLNECAGKTIIGDNVFIGMGSIIMPGVRIGSNVIIGSGSVVTRDVPDDSVAAGNPAKVICSIEAFYQKRKAQQIDDAFRLVKIIRDAYNREPTIAEMGSFFPLFLPRDAALLKKYNIFVNLSGDNPNVVITDWLDTEPAFSSFADFLEKSKNTPAVHKKADS